MDKQVFITLKQQYEIARIDEDKEAPVVNVLDEGRVSLLMSYPRRKLIIFFCFFLSCMLFLLMNFIVFRVNQ